MSKGDLEERMRGLRTTKPEPKPEPEPKPKAVKVAKVEPKVKPSVAKVLPGDEEYEAMYAVWEANNKAATNFAYPSPEAEYVRYVKVQEASAEKPVFLVSENAADVI